MTTTLTIPKPVVACVKCAALLPITDELMREMRERWPNDPAQRLAGTAMVVSGWVNAGEDPGLPTCRACVAAITAEENAKRQCPTWCDPVHCSGFVVEFDEVLHRRLWFTDSDDLVARLSHAERADGTWESLDVEVFAQDATGPSEIEEVATVLIQVSAFLATIAQGGPA